MSIKGGNWQIFDHMVKLSNAKSYMNHKVTSIERTSSGYGLKAVTKSDSESVQITSQYDAVIIAALSTAQTSPSSPHSPLHPQSSTT